MPGDLDFCPVLDLIATPELLLLSGVHNPSNFPLEERDEALRLIAARRNYA
jgi:hypothetical protein